MALAAVGVFCAGLEDQLDEAVQQARHLSLEATLLEGLRVDITEQLQELRAALPTEELETRETSRDVQYLQGRAEALQGENGRLRQALAVHKAAHGELMRRLALRDMILDGLRTEALAGRDGGAALSLEFYDKVEAELDLARAGFTRELNAAEQRHATAERRLEGRLRNIIEAKEKEIIQLQLNFNAMLRSREGDHSRDVTTAAAEIGKLRSAAEEAQRQAELSVEARVAEAIAKERVAGDLRAAEAAAMRDAELKYLKQTLDEQGRDFANLSDKNGELESQLHMAQSSLAHVAHVELPHAVAAVRKRERARQAEAMAGANERVAAAEAAKAAAEKKVEELTATLAKLEADRDLARQQASSLRTESANKDSAMRELTNQVAAAQRERDQIKRDLADAQAEIDLMRRTAGGGGAGDASAVADWIKRCEALKNDLRNATSVAAADAEAHQKELNAALSALDRARARTREMEDEHARLNHRLAAQQMRAESLEAQLTAMGRTKDSLEKSVVNLRLERSGSSAAGERLRAAARLAATGSQASGASEVVVEVPAAHYGGGGSPPQPPQAVTVTAGGDAEAPLELAPTLLNSFSPRSGSPRGVPPPAAVTRRPSASPSATARKASLAGSLNAPVPTKDAGVECKILDLPIERVSVRAGTAIGHNTARAEQRAMNAFLRDELAILRIVLRLPPPPPPDAAAGEAGLLPTYPEHEPIPIATADAVAAQNDRLAEALRRRRELARLHGGSADSVAAFSSRPGSSACALSTSAATGPDPVAELLRSAGAPLRFTRRTSPDSDYVEAPAAAGQQPVEGTVRVAMRILSPRSGNGAVRGAHVNVSQPGSLQSMGAGFKRPKSAASASRPLSARPQSSFGEYSPRFRLASDLSVDPVTYFAVGGRLHATSVLAAEGRTATAPPGPPLTAAAAPAADDVEAAGEAAAEPAAAAPVDVDFGAADGSDEGGPNMRMRSAPTAPLPPDAKLPAAVTPRPPSANPSFRDVMRQRREEAERPGSDRPGAVRVGGAGFRQPQQRRPWSARR